VVDVAVLEVVEGDEGALVVVVVGAITGGIGVCSAEFGGGFDGVKSYLPKMLTNITWASGWLMNSTLPTPGAWAVTVVSV
jgi:hypothetical protein